MNKNANSFPYSVCLCSVLRIIAIALAPIMYYPSWAGQPIALWTSIEANLALICCSLPILRPLAVRIWRKYRPKGRRRLSISHLSEKLRSRSADESSSNTSEGRKTSNRSDSNDASSNASANKSIMVHTTYQISTIDNAQRNSVRYVSLVFFAYPDIAMGISIIGEFR